MAIPIIEISSVDHYTISDEININRCTIQFKITNTDIKRFEIRATKDNSFIGRGQGLLVEKDNTLFPSISLLPSIDLYPYEYNLPMNSTQESYIDFNELTSGDGNYTISIYTMGVGGEWNE